MLFAATLAAVPSQSDVNARIGAASDYVLRGFQQTVHGPAYFGAIEQRWDSGVYAGVWGSRVNYGGTDVRDIETAVFVGYNHRIARNVAVDLLTSRYIYPTGGQARHYDWSENQVAVHLGDSWTVRAGYTNRWLGRAEDLPFYEASFRYPLPLEITADAMIGHYQASSAIGIDYGYAEIGLSRPLYGFVGRIVWSGVESNARERFSRWVDNRVSASAVWTF